MSTTTTFSNDVQRKFETQEVITESKAITAADSGKTFLISGLIDDYRIKTNIFAISPNHAIKVFQQKYPNATDIYLIQKI